MSDLILQGVSPSGGPLRLQVDSNGYLKINQAAGGGSGGTSSSFASAFPSTGTAIGASDGTNMVALLVDGSGNLKVVFSGSLPAGTNVIGHVVVDSAGSVSITSLPALPAGTNVIGHVIVDSASSVAVTSLPALAAGSNTIGGVNVLDSAGTNKLAVDASGRVSVLGITNALPAGTNVIGHVIVDTAPTTAVTESGTWTVQPGNTANTTAWLVQDVVGTTNGSTGSHLLSAASNNATNAKNSAGLLYGVNLSNTNASVRYVKFYNKASAPAPATDNALLKHVFMVPGNSVIQRIFPKGLAFSSGISFAAVTGSSDTDNTSVGAGDLIIDFDYN